MMLSTTVPAFRKVVLYFDPVPFVSVAVKAGQSDIVFLGATTSRDGYLMVKLDLVISKMAAAVLASVIVAPYDAHLSLEGYIPTAPPRVCGFC